MSHTALLALLLQLGDDNLILSQRLGELVSWMPDVEEDVAVANLCVDHLGQARNFYSYAAEIQGSGGDEDQIAMERDEREFLNAVLVEQPNGDFAHTIARQFFFDAYQVPLYESLGHSSNQGLSAIAEKASKEARYHLKFSSRWVVRLGDGTKESRQRMQAGVEALWPFTADLFETAAGSAELARAGVDPDMDGVRTRFDSAVESILAEATLDAPSDPYQRLGGRTGTHTEHLGHILPAMQALHRAHPGVQW